MPGVNFSRSELVYQGLGLVDDEHREAETKVEITNEDGSEVFRVYEK